MRFQVLSDLHLEFYKEDIPLIKPSAKYLFLAGDIGNLSTTFSTKNLKNFFDYVSKNWEKTFYITGNHEYYHSYKTKTELDLEYQTIIQSYHNIHFLNSEKNIFVLEDEKVEEKVEIIGCTLWSKPELTSGFNDFTSIQYYDKTYKMNEYVGLTQFYEWNTIDYEFLKHNLEKKTTNKRIVMTHFLPLTNKQIPNSKYNDDYSSYFGNDFKDLMLLTDVWISGHTHEIFQTNIESTKWIGNPYGYPGENDIHNNEMIFEI